MTTAAPSNTPARSGTYYYLGDGLGSVMKTTDSTGAVVNSYTYDVYGAVTSSSGTQTNELDFAGEQTDPTTGLQFLRARYYDPTTGTFISRDPLSIGIGWSGHTHGCPPKNWSRWNERNRGRWSCPWMIRR